MGERDAVVGVVGLGLIGGSVARAVVDAGGAVVAWDPDEATVASARAAGIRVLDDVAAVVAAVPPTGLVVVATPLAESPDAVAGVLAAAGPDGPTVTDVASVKGPVLAAAAEHPAFVSSHPMAGVEHSGFGASSPELFTGAPWLVLVPDTADLTRVAAVCRVALALGARPVPLDPSGHDVALAAVSHVPHVLAAVLTLQSAPHLSLAAGSLHGAARVAAGDPALPTAMVEQNREAVVGALDELIDALRAFRDDPEPVTTFAAAQRVWVARSERDTVEVEVPLEHAALRAVGAAGGHLRWWGEGSATAVVPVEGADAVPTVEAHG